MLLLFIHNFKKMHINQQVREWCLKIKLIYIKRQMAFYGVQLNAQANRLFGQIKLTLNKNNYLPNFRTIYRSMANYDPEQSGYVSLGQFEKALQENGIFFKKFEIQVFQKAFEEDGRINWFSFMQLLREPLNEFRSDLIEQIYDSIDPDHSGQIYFADLSKLFNPSEFLEFKLKHKSKETIEKELFGLVPLTPEGYITKEEFVNFYSDLSLNIPSDTTFAKFVSSHWNYPYKQQARQTPEQIKEAIRIVRFKLIQRVGGTHEEFLLKQVFNEFDTNKNGYLSEDELHTMLIKLEIPTDKNLLKPLLKKLDVSGNGFVEYDEFKNFLFFDPYPI